MDPFHERLARLALEASANYGFCLAGEELLRMAADHDPGFDPGIFAEALRAVRRFPASAFEPYQLTSDQVEAMSTRLLACPRR
jgi:hypothetical protein